MTNQKQTYKNPQAGQALITTISSGCKTPEMFVKFSNLVRPFYYPNSPTIPRYSVTCVFGPDECEDFIKGIQTIEKNEDVDSVIKAETAKEGGVQVYTGNMMIKFQTKEKIPVYLSDPETSETLLEPISLEDELAKGEKIIVAYEILRYTKKNTMKTEHGITFKPVYIYLLQG